MNQSDGDDQEYKMCSYVRVNTIVTIVVNNDANRLKIYVFQSVTEACLVKVNNLRLVKCSQCQTNIDISDVAGENKKKKPQNCTLTLIKKPSYCIRRNVKKTRTPVDSAA